MRFLFFVLTGYCLGLVVSDDSIAVESEANYQRIHNNAYSEESAQKEEGFQERAHKKYHSGYDKRQNLVHREREARGEDSRRFSHRPKIGGSAYELPPGYEIEGKYGEEPKHSVIRYYPSTEETGKSKMKEEKENLKVESSQHPGMTGSFLSHIKEQMNDGKLLGFSSFVEHFSENDDAEELKTAMREGSLEDIKKLVPKSAVSFQMYHGEEQQRTVKTEPVPEGKPETSWNELNEWQKPVTWTQPQYIQPAQPSHFIIPDRKKRMRKPEKFKLNRHRPNHVYHSEEARDDIQTTVIPEVERPRVVVNEIKEEENYPQIVSSIKIEVPNQSFQRDKENEAADYRGEGADYNYAYDGETETATAWRPIGEKAVLAASELHKVVNTPKPPESSKIYYEHFKSSKAFEDTSKFSQLPKVGRVILEQPVKHTQTAKANLETQHYIKKPLRVKSASQPSFKKPILALGEDYHQRYAQVPTATPSSLRLATPQPTRPVSPQPTRIWSKPDTTRDSYGKFRSETPLRPSTPIRLEKILNKQTENHEQIERPGKENGNIFLTKEFQNDLSEFFNGGKSDFEWVPSTQIRYDTAAHGSNPASFVAEAPEPKKKKKYRINRSDRNTSQGVPKNIIFIDPENEKSPGEFSVSASYQIDKNRKSSDHAP